MRKSSFGKWIFNWNRFLPSWFKIIYMFGDIINDDNFHEFPWMLHQQLPAWRSKNTKTSRSSSISNSFFPHLFVWFGSDEHSCWGWHCFLCAISQDGVDIMQPALVLRLIGISRTQVRIVRRRSLLLLQVTRFNPSIPIDLSTHLFTHLSYPSLWVPTLMSKHAPYCARANERKSPREELNELFN